MIRQRIPRQSERIRVEILDGDTVVADRSFTGSKTAVEFPFTIPDAKLWDTEHPNLYRARVSFGDDVVEEHFGIRTLACVMGDKFIKFGATLYPCDLKTRGAYANMDLAGYNYGIWRTPGPAERRPEAMRMWNPVGSGRMSRR